MAENPFFAPSSLPYRLPPVRIQRWSWRRVVLTVATLFGLLLFVLIVISVLGQPL